MEERTLEDFKSDIGLYFSKLRNLIMEYRNRTTDETMQEEYFQLWESLINLENKYSAVKK